MQTAIGIAGVLSSLGLLWSGRLKFGSFPSTLFSIVGLLGTVVAVLSLGWLGIALLASVNLVAILVWSRILALRVEEKLRYAATETGESMPKVKALAKALRRQEGLRWMSPTEQAEIIKLLAERARSVEEIEDVAPAVGSLALLHGASLPWLVEHFDRLLRVAEEPASKATEAAATLSASTQQAAASLKEILEAMIIVYSGEPPAQEAA